MLNPRTEEIYLSLYPNKNHEVIEELEVPEGEEPADYLLELKTEVYLGDRCESRTRY